MTHPRHHYAGIGSRETPGAVLDQCTQLAGLMERVGLILRSGGAQGADLAFERGVRNPDYKQIFRPTHATIEAMKIASRIHPRWDLLSNYGRQLHGRNVQIVLGLDLTVPVKFLVCWTPGGYQVGGTRTAMVLAKQRKIPLYNLADLGQYERLMGLAERVLR